MRFINRCAKTIPDDVAMETDTYNQLDPAVAYIHGACLVFLDGLGAGKMCQKYLQTMLKEVLSNRDTVDSRYVEFVGNEIKIRGNESST